MSSNARVNGDTTMHSKGLRLKQLKISIKVSKYLQVMVKKQLSTSFLSMGSWRRTRSKETKCSFKLKLRVDRNVLSLNWLTDFMSRFSGLAWT